MSWAKIWERVVSQVIVLGIFIALALIVESCG